MAVNENLQALIREALVPLQPAWQSPQQEADLQVAREREAVHPDQYWAWAAEHFNWSSPWHTLREGTFPDFRYFVGGMLNVAENCVDRYADDLKHAEKPAIIWEGEPGEVRAMTYRQLRNEVSRVANGLLSLGIAKGDVVAIYMQNLPEVFVAIHACNRIGAIYTVIFSGFSSDAVALRLLAAEAKAVILSDVSFRRGRKVPLLANFRRARERVPSVEHAIVVARSGETASLRRGEVSYAELLKSQSETCPCVPLEANEPAFLIFTSGTEAKPKGLVHSAAGFLIGTWANVKWQIGLQDDDVYWCAADVGWLTFPIQAVIGGLAHGGALVCYEGALDFPSPERFYEIVERHGITKILSAPTALRMLRRVGDEVAARHPMPQLRLVSVQGEPLDPETFRWASTSLGPGIPVINAYGQTETGSTWTYPVYGVDALKAGSCGVPVPGHHAMIVNEQGQPLPAGQKGNLVLLHPFPTLARTIWKDHERYVQTYYGRFPGKYWTADEAIEDADRQLWVLGRADDVINVAGHRMSTMEIEAVVTAHPAVAEGAVTGVPDPLKGMVPVAFLCVRSGADPAVVVQEVNRLVDDGIGRYAHLNQVYIVDTLPKTRAGKIMRRLLREVVEQGHVSGDTTGLEDREAIDSVMAGVGRKKQSGESE